MIRELHRISEKTGQSMTVLVDRAVEESAEEYRREKANDLFPRCASELEPGRGDDGGIPSEHTE